MLSHGKSASSFDVKPLYDAGQSQVHTIPFVGTDDKLSTYLGM